MKTAFRLSAENCD